MQYFKKEIIMKKLLCLILTLVISMLLIGCSGNSKEPAPTDEPEVDIYTKEDGVLKREVYYNPNGLNFSTIIYEYDGAGRVAKELSFGINKAPESYRSFEYDADGRCVEEVNYLAKNADEYTEDFRIAFSYDEAGQLVKEVRSIGSAIAAVTTYEYAEDKLVTEKHFEGESELIAEYTYEYDDNGKRSVCKRNDCMEGIKTENRYTYDADGRLIADLLCDEAGEVVNRTEYTYDANGNEIKCSVFTVGGELISSTKNEYMYDDPGNIIKVVRTQTDGAQGTTIEYVWEYSKG